MVKISNISVLGGYLQRENQVTSAFFHLLELGGEELLSQLLSYKDFDSPTPLFDITCQYTGRGGSRPDGAITKCYNILFEMKIAKFSKKDVTQMNAHLKKLTNNPFNYLIYITTDKRKPFLLKDPRIIWFNWVEICDIFNLFAVQHTDLFKYLCVEFEKLLENFNIIDNNVANRVLIVGGKIGAGVAKTYSIYLYQMHRTFLPSKYIAFYSNYLIQEVYEITKELQDQNLLTCSDIPPNYLQNKEPYYQSSDRRNVFILKTYLTNLNIKCNKKTSNGNSCAFIQSHTYTTIDKIKKATKTSQL